MASGAMSAAPHLFGVFERDGGGDGAAERVADEHGASNPSAAMRRDRFGRDLRPRRPLARVESRGGPLHHDDAVLADEAFDEGV